MLSKKLYFTIYVSIIIFTVYSNTCKSQNELPELQESKMIDTVTVDEKSLDSIKFYMSANSTRIDNNSKDTIFLSVEDKVYRIPVNVTSTALVNLQRKAKYFKVTGLLLSEDNLDLYLKELFRNPREKLKDSISAINWKNNDIYLQYFERYDENSPYSGDNNTGNNKSSENELESFLSDGSNGYVEQNYDQFPLPQSIDLEVDLTKSPRVLTVLGLEFNFDKLDKGFQELLLKYGYSSNKKYLNRRSNEEKNENN